MSQTQKYCNDLLSPRYLPEPHAMFRQRKSTRLISARQNQENDYNTLSIHSQSQIPFYRDFTHMKSSNSAHNSNLSQTGTLYDGHDFSLFKSFGKPRGLFDVDSKRH